MCKNDKSVKKCITLYKLNIAVFEIVILTHIYDCHNFLLLLIILYI